MIKALLLKLDQAIEDSVHGSIAREHAFNRHEVMKYVQAHKLNLTDDVIDDVADYCSSTHGRSPTTHTIASRIKHNMAHRR